MKRFFPGILALAALTAAVAPASAQTLPQADRDHAQQYLETTKRNIVEATGGLSEAQWNFKPSPFKWSVAQVVEHIAAAEDMLRGIIEQQVLKAPAPPERDVKQVDEAVLKMVPDRSFKAQAPPPLRPTNRYNSPDAALKHFLESRAKTEELLAKTADLRAHAIEGPMKQKLDGYQWVLLIAAHSERHTKQLNEVKSDAKFPR